MARFDPNKFNRELRAAERRAEAEHKRRVDAYNRQVDQHNKKAISDYNREIVRVNRENQRRIDERNPEGRPRMGAPRTFEWILFVRFG